jgi:hypothetical protein
MTDSLRGGRKPVLWLALVAGLLAVCVQSGELGSADTMHRLQTAHSFWTHEPAVFPQEYPEFGAHGRGGRLYDWYGVGQPLLLLPADIVGTGVSKLPILADYGDTDPTVRNIVVTYTTNTLISVLTALVCYRFLVLLGFDAGHSIAGVLALLLSTTHLHYTQNMMENNYIMLLSLTGFRYQYEWLRTGKPRALLFGSLAFGLNLLTRLTTALDLMAGGVFLLLVLLLESGYRQRIWSGLIEYAKVALPVYCFFLLCDRLYQFYRFGTWTDTYVHHFALERRLQDPALAVNYPWTTPFHVGFLGAFISPEKSIFLFDPLLLLTVVVAVFAWRRLNAAIRAYLVTGFGLILAYVCLYARYYEWSGNFAWGDRYVSTAVEMAAFISVPLLLRLRQELGTVVWVFGVMVICASFVIQLASLAFWLPLEIYQTDDFGHPQWVIWLRVKNIVAFASGKMAAWGLNTDSMTYDQWDYQHITCWNFLPFVLRRIGEAPNWVVDAAFGLWGAAMTTLAYCLGKLAGEISHPPEMNS